LLLATAASQAQEIRKYITPDGKTIYSDTPIPGAREAGSVASPPPVDPEAREEAEAAAREAAERANESAAQRQQEAAGLASIEDAEKQLEMARETLAAGKEPLPGERTGTAGGGSRLTDAYFERQRANEQALRDAERALEEARARR
jgi:hypothetical protein